MQKQIAFYISDEGLEHALRNIPILDTLFKMEEELTLHVKSGSEQIQLIKAYLGQKEGLHFYEMEMMEKEPDRWEEAIEAETAFLKQEKIGLIVSDICPWIFRAADELRIKSLLIGHFTWADLYPEEEEMQDAYLECYEMASKMLLYDLHTKSMESYGVSYEEVSFVSRPHDMEKITQISYSVSQPIVFYDIPVQEGIPEQNDVEKLPYHFLAMEGSNLKGKNVTFLPSDTKDIQDYVAASSFVIAQMSWNRCGQILLSNRKSALLAREGMELEKDMLHIIKDREQCVVIEKKQLKDLGTLLEKLEQFTYSYEKEYHNNDYEIGKKILFSYPEKRRRNRS